jgi:N-acetylmuramoyl-L-alanine amidase
MQTLRHGPRQGYFAIFQPAAVRALAVGAEGDWYRLLLCPGQYAWAHRNSVRVLPHGVLPPTSEVRAVHCYTDDSRTRWEFPLSGKHPFRIIEEESDNIKLQLFGVTSNTDWIRYDTANNLVESASWFQPSPGLYEFSFRLSQGIWGYDTYYSGNTLVLSLKLPPTRLGELEGKTIVIDPGHSTDPGAIGPTGLTEAEANLAIALVLRDELTRNGAEVVMTRTDNSNVALQDRPAIAKAADADLFVSVHNNASPDGVNPIVHHGSSVYYYHPHSLELARAVHRELIREAGLGDHGIYYGNLAVNRPTQYPAVLVECAFMILPEDEALLKTETFRRQVARGIHRGIERFLRGRADER